MRRKTASHPAEREGTYVRDLGQGEGINDNGTHDGAGKDACRPPPSPFPP